MYFCIHQINTITQGSANCSPWAKSCFSFVGPQSRKIFASLSDGGRESKEYHCMASENYLKCKFQCPKIKFYRNTAVLSHLVIIYGYFCSETAKLNSCLKDHMACKAYKNIYCLTMYRSLLRPAVACYNWLVCKNDIEEEMVIIEAVWNYFHFRAWEKKSCSFFWRWFQTILHGSVCLKELIPWNLLPLYFYPSFLYHFF